MWRDFRIAKLLVLKCPSITIVCSDRINALALYFAHSMSNAEARRRVESSSLLEARSRSHHSCIHQVNEKLKYEPDTEPEHDKQDDKVKGTTEECHWK
jgi:hypothetical protein